MNTILDQYRDIIIEACKKHHVNTLYTFGSVNTDRFSEDSDIDFLVSFKREEIPLEEFADVYFDFQFFLEDTLQREIDLVTERSIKNPYFRQEVMDTRILFYEANLN